jgi:hypothetical protein
MIQSNTEVSTFILIIVQVPRWLTSELLKTEKKFLHDHDELNNLTRLCHHTYIQLFVYLYVTRLYGIRFPWISVVKPPFFGRHDMYHDSYPRWLPIYELG